MEAEGGLLKLQSAVFTVRGLNEKNNELHVAITERQKRSHFAGVVENSFVIAVSRRQGSPTSESEPCICVNVFALDSDLLPDPQRQSVTAADSQLRLFCTERFLVHYRFNKHETIYVRTLTPSPLTKITLATDNCAAFTWASSHIFSTGLLLSICNQHNVIARTGDVFAIPYSELFQQDTKFNILFLTNLEVVETEPFYQGAVMVNSELLILNKSVLDVKDNGSNKSETEPLKNPSAVRVSDFAVPLTSVFIPRQINKPTLYRNTHNTICLQRDWNILPYKYLHIQSHSRAMSSADHIVYADISTLKKFNLFDASLIEIVLEANYAAQVLSQASSIAQTRTDVNQKNTKKKLANICRVVHLKVLGHEIKDSPSENLGFKSDTTLQKEEDKLFLPCSLLFNLQRGHTKHIGQDLMVKIRVGLFTI